MLVAKGGIWLEALDQPAFASARIESRSPGGSGPEIILGAAVDGSGLRRDQRVNEKFTGE
jgi:hypothetical protein